MVSIAKGRSRHTTQSADYEMRGWLVPVGCTYSGSGSRRVGNAISLCADGNG